MAYWKSRGVNTSIYVGECCEQNGSNSIYFGIINNHFSNYDLFQVQKHNAEIIELPTKKRTLPCKVRAWDDNKWDVVETYLLWINENGTPKYPYECVDVDNLEEFEKGEMYDTDRFQNIEYIDEPRKEEIAEIKGQIEELEADMKEIRELSKTIEEKIEKLKLKIKS